MLNTKELRIRVTPDQHARIQMKAQLNGYESVSAYIRDRIIKTPYKAEQRLREIHDLLKRKE